MLNRIEWQRLKRIRIHQLEACADRISKDIIFEQTKHVHSNGHLKVLQDELDEVLKETAQIYSSSYEEELAEAKEREYKGGVIND